MARITLPIKCFKGSNFPLVSLLQINISPTPNLGSSFKELVKSFIIKVTKLFIIVFKITFKY